MSIITTCYVLSNDFGEHRFVFYAMGLYKYAVTSESLVVIIINPEKTEFKFNLLSKCE